MLSYHQISPYVKAPRYDDRSQIWQASQQRCCLDASHISEQWNQTPNLAVPRFHKIWQKESLPLIKWIKATQRSGINNSNHVTATTTLHIEPRLRNLTIPKYAQTQMPYYHCLPPGLLNAVGANPVLLRGIRPQDKTSLAQKQLFFYFISFSELVHLSNAMAISSALWILMLVLQCQGISSNSMQSIFEYTDAGCGWLH